MLASVRVGRAAGALVEDIDGYGEAEDGSDATAEGGVVEARRQEAGHAVERRLRLAAARVEVRGPGRGAVRGKQVVELAAVEDAVDVVGDGLAAARAGEGVEGRVRGDACAGLRRLRPLADVGVDSLCSGEQGSELEGELAAPERKVGSLLLSVLARSATPPR